VDGYEMSTDPSRLDVDAVHAWLANESYWAVGREREVTDRSIAGSICVGAYAVPDGEQAGFARVVTDRATFAWLCDVFVFEAHRGHGLARTMVRAAMDLPELATVRLWLLATADAHGVYAPLGFERIDADRWMTRRAAVPETGGYRDP
jgi:GNAT superfamily N-acetyltransferase